ncbi:MAG TPA: hypothetical protein VMA75_03035 [Candidatus Paceibacterota bacterium]|nr:hypothetical protein [Candidatus Paceibacterota bacterium]
MESDHVIETIKSGKAKMRPRSYFIAQAVLAIIAAALLFFLILFLATFAIFSLEENGGLFAIDFGLSGWAIFFESLPWTVLLLSLAFILILWILLRRYPLVYQQPFLYTLLILIAAISLVSFFLSGPSLQGGLMQYAYENQLPLLSGVYKYETTPTRGIYRGEVVLMIANGFVLEDALGNTSTIFMAPGAGSELSAIGPGEYVLIFGRFVATSTIEASGLEKIVDYE